MLLVQLRHWFAVFSGVLDGRAPQLAWHDA
jgi:hypothetical protein